MTVPVTTDRRSAGRALAAAIAGASGAVLVPLLTGTLAARLEAAFGMGPRDLGLVLAAFFATSGLLSTFGGRLSDRLGWAAALRLGAAGSATTLLFIAVVADGIPTLVAGLVLGGASLSLSMPASSLAIAEELPSDRRGSGGFVPTAGMMVAGLAGFGLLAIHTPVATVAGALVAYGLGWGWPGLFYFGAVVHFPHRPGVATGAVQAGLSSGSAIGPLAMGLVIDAAGYPVGWSAAATAMLLGAALIAIGARRVVRPDGAHVGAPTER